ncbi:MAG: siroheme synthase [Pseudomonadota bacterium]
MKAFPLFLNVAGKPVVIVGGGEQAAQKARLVAKTEAAMVLVAPALVPELADRVSGGARHIAAVFEPAAVEGADLAFVCTGCAGADAAISGVIQNLGTLVNVVDRPDLCDVTTPAIVDRDPAVVAIGTEGAAPVLARQIKTTLEANLEPALGKFTALAGALRPRVERHVVKAKRRAFWEWFFTAPRRRFTAGDREGALAEIEDALAAGGPPTGARGNAYLVDVSHRQPDLVTLRTVARLQAADLILHDEATAPGILELARRDAERDRHAARGLDPSAAVETLTAGERVVILVTTAQDAAAARAAFAAAGQPLETPDTPASVQAAE